MNRGYVLHDQRQGEAAAADFNTALRIDPKNGEAHLGLAYADLDLHHARAALEQVALAEKVMGDSVAIHLVRGTAYGSEGLLKREVAEYRIAAKANPTDPKIHIAIASALYVLHEYQEAINEFQESDHLGPGNGVVYAELARCYAQLHQRNQTMHYIELAEKPGPSTIFLTTGEALSTLGEQKAAMARFERALAAPDADRVQVRLAIAHLMVSRGQMEDSRRQVTLAFMEASAAARSSRPRLNSCRLPMFSSGCMSSSSRKHIFSARWRRVLQKLTCESGSPMRIWQPEMLRARRLN